jgi:hypothetical protein
VSESATEGLADLDEREIHDVLRNDRRRLALEALRERGGQATVRELSEQIASQETGEAPPPRDTRQSVYVSLHQTHLPKLDTLSIVEYKPDEKDVTLTERIQAVEVYMEVVPEYGLSWGEFYFGLALLGLLTAVAAVLDVPGVSRIGLTLVVIGFFGIQLVAAAYHVYSQQDRVIFQRLFE